MSNNYEAEVIEGIEDVAIHELSRLSSLPTSSIKQYRSGYLRFQFNGNSKSLACLRSVIAIYQIHRFEIPRPKALLGHQNFARLVEILNSVIGSEKDSFKSMSIGAAGANSPVMQRILIELATSLQLEVATEDKGDLYIRLIPALKRNSWEVLVRVSPRPFATRNWRVQNIPGALNATVAYAMTQIVDSQSANRAVNLCSGSGTILIEHAKSDTLPPIIGIEINPEMNSSAIENMYNSDIKPITLIQSDATNAPFADASFDLIYADLPFGQLMGTHEENLQLYPAILKEAVRISTFDATFVVLTHEIKLMEKAVQYSAWEIQSIRQINLNGLHPCIFILEKIRA